MIRVCFVCLGNICRSPTAEGVMQKLVADAGLSGSIEVDSAGTAGYHAGEPADARSRAAAKQRGVTLHSRARQFVRKDWERFELVLAMDGSNRADLASLAPSDAARAKLHLLRDFDPQSPRGSGVPDPYYGGGHGFEEVLDECFAACAALLEHLRREHGL